MDEDLADLFSKDLNALTILLTSKATKTAITIDEFIKLSLLNGASEETIKAELLKDLQEGGRLFGEFRNSIKATANGFINRTRDSAQWATIGLDNEYRWVAVMVNTCPDCIDRHNEVKKYSEWEIEGLPRTGYTVCKENCKCVLVPVYTPEIEPIRRTK